MSFLYNYRSYLLTTAHPIPGKRDAQQARGHGRQPAPPAHDQRQHREGGREAAQGRQAVLAREHGRVALYCGHGA